MGRSSGMADVVFRMVVKLEEFLKHASTLARQIIGHLSGQT
ncbi:unnamed protein product [Linum tenue]|uniref:Uncharacterized protein n=1 Tax=Linum tenue TaxID=586396 RepID=A0AAV0N0T7_9ROSI|nr:unnamed protein product [Linum tenue]